MQANVNLDALLEKMKAELERAKRFEPLKFDETVEECIDRVRALVEEKERLRGEINQLAHEIEWRKGQLEQRNKLHGSFVEAFLISVSLTLLVFVFALDVSESVAIGLGGIGAIFTAMLGGGIIFNFSKRRSIINEINELKKKKEKLEIKYWETPIEKLAREKIW